MSEIDVSKCELIYNDRCFASQKQGIGNPCHKSDYCKYNTNCYYKQLQQLKAENEELKKQLQEESDLAHKAVQEEADSFFEALKYEKVINKIEEYCNKYGQNSIGFKKKIQAFIKEVKE